MKPNCCNCQACSPQTVNLFTNPDIENSHPASLKTKPNPLSCPEHPHLQNLGSSFPQLPTKMLPKSTPPLQSHFSDPASSSHHAGIRATFNTNFKYSVNPGTRLGHCQNAPCRASPLGQLASSQVVVCHTPAASCPTLVGALLVQPGLINTTQSWAVATGEQKADNASSPASQKTHPQTVFQRDAKLIK